jgi:hypothetical protein
MSASGMSAAGHSLSVRRDHVQLGGRVARRDADEEMAETIAEIYAESGQPDEEDRLWARRVLGLEP